MTKILTDTLRIETTTTQAVQQITTHQALQESIRQFALDHLIKTQATKAMRTLDVQRLMNYIRMAHYFNITQILPPKERTETINKLLLTPLEEQEIEAKGILPLRRIQDQKLKRQHITRLEKWLETQKEHILSPMACTLIDHTALCLMDKYLWTSLREETEQILDQLKHMTISKSRYIPALPPIEAIQKQMLQLYVPLMHTHPFSVNLLALRLSMLTEEPLKNERLTIYYYGSIPAEAVKTKPFMLLATEQLLISKAISSGKPRHDAISTKIIAGGTESFTGDEIVDRPRNPRSRETMFMALRYLYQMPYWIRRMMAVHYGMPENHKYANYFAIGGLPRRGTKFWHELNRVPEARYLQYSADEYVAKIIRKYNARRRAFYARYGEYYKRKRP